MVFSSIALRRGLARAAAIVGLGLAAGLSAGAANAVAVQDPIRLMVISDPDIGIAAFATPDVIWTAPGQMDTGLSVVDFPRTYQVTFPMTDLHFDIPQGQADLDDITVGTTGFSNVMVMKTAGMMGTDKVEVFFDALPAGTMFTIDSDFSIDKITVTGVPLPAAAPMLLAGAGLLVAAARRRKAA